MTIQNRHFLQNIKGIGYGKNDVHEQSTSPMQPAPKGSGGQDDDDKGPKLDAWINTGGDDDTPSSTDEQRLAKLMAGWTNNPNAMADLLALLGNWSNGSPPPLADIIAQVQGV